MTRRSVDDAVDLARQWLHECPAVLITAGAGLSVPAGVDYYDTAWFKHNFPAMVKRGFSYPYELVGHPDLFANPKLRWGYLIAFANAIAHVPQHSIYQRLKTFCESRRDFFVKTSNADGLFVTNGFAPDRVYTLQGSWRFVQCLGPCSPTSVFPAGPYIEKLLPQINSETQEIPPEQVPRCPHCGGDMMFNLNGGPFYTPIAYAEQQVAEQSFLSASLRSGQDGNGRLLIVEIGAGFNTPGVLRYPNETLVGKYPTAVRLIRVNMDPRHAAVPGTLSANAVGLPISVADFLELLP